MIEMPFMAPPRFEVGIAAPGPAAGAHWFVFQSDRLLVELGPPSSRATDDPRVARRPSWARLPWRKSNTSPHGLGLKVVRTLYLGRLDGAECWAAELAAGAAPPEGLGWEGLRALFSVLDDAHLAIAGRAIQLLEWDRDHRFCGRCGAPTAAKPDERARQCGSCGLAAYPRIAPAVMALARRGRRILLGRSPHFPPGMYSALAGFVEPGETLEQCVARELEEEVGIRVANVRYFASQPWPFPHSLMIAFVCDWAEGELRPREGEIEAAEWFDVLQLPRLPSKISIARRLIDAEVGRISGEMRAGLA
jgi:NAD+ diphosphatase